MAGLQERNGSYRYSFRYHGKHHFVTLGKVSAEEAKTKSAQVDYLLLRLKQRLIHLPPGVGVVEFIRHDGKPAIPHVGNEIVAKELILSAFCDRYLKTHRNSLEVRTIEGIELHFKHLLGALGERFPIRELKLVDLQGYVDLRATAKGTGGRRLSAATIRKEVVSLRTAWNWGTRMELVAGRFPNTGLRYPKTEEKPPFQTREEILRQIDWGGLKPHQKTELWHALYLQKPEIEEALEVVRIKAGHPWIYAIACTAAHTGARRSELIRMRVTDIDFGGRTITVREKKRVRGQHTTRRVPLTDFLAGVLRDYLKVHPGGQALFCHGHEVARSKKRSRTTGHQSSGSRETTLKARLASISDRVTSELVPLTEDEAHDHLKRTLKGSKWEIIKGYHPFRHSFISACASKGVDQRMIQEWCGHMTAAMQKRYAHLYPSAQADALKSVFG
jgi:integrase